MQKQEGMTRRKAALPRAWPAHSGPMSADSCCC